MKPIVYSGSVNIGRGGIGDTASHHVKPLFEAGLLEWIYAKDAVPPYDSITSKIGVDNVPYEVSDLFFDGVVSLMKKESKLLWGWGGHCLFTFRATKMFKAMGCYSAHISEQKRLLEGESEENLVSPLMERKVSEELEMADAIHVPSEFVFNSLKKHGLAQKAKLIPFGVDLEKFRPAKREDDIFRVIFVGRNLVRKGLKYLLQAWIQLDLKDAELIVVGCEPIKDFPNDSVVFQTWVDDLVKLYQSGDVFCLPAVEDGCPLVSYETMASGLPNIVSENTGTYQHIMNGKNGYVVRAKSSNEIADKLQYLYENRDECKWMGENSRKIAEEFPWSRFENDYLGWMKSLLEECK